MAREYVAKLRWPDGEQVCPRCGVPDEHYFLSTRKNWKCKECQKQFSIKVHTIYEGSPLSRSKWLPGSQVRARVVANSDKHELKGHVRANVVPGASDFTDNGRFTEARQAREARKCGSSNDV